MSELIDRIKNHAVFDELRALGKAIDTALSREHSDPVVVIDALERLRAVLTYAGKRLSAIDPAVSDPRPLTSIQNTFAKARSELEAYATDGNIAHIAPVNSHGDDVIAALAAVVTVQVSDDLTALNEAAGTYRSTLEVNIRTARELVAKLTAETKDGSEKVQALTNDVNAEKQKVVQLFAEQQAAFTKAQSEQQTAFATAQTERQANAANATAESLKQFTESQASRAKEYAALIAEHSKKLTEQDTEFTLQRDARLKAQDQALAELKSKYLDEAAGILAKVEKNLADVQKLVGVIGNTGVTAGYQKMANHARNALYVWQGVTVLSLAALIGVAYWIAFGPPPTSDAAFYQGISTRIFLSVTVGIFAAYAAKQAANFWQVERHNRKLALELEAIGPYIEPLPEDMRHQFRRTIGDRSFGVSDGHAQSVSERGPVSLLDIVKSKEFKDVITDAVKAIK